MPEKSVKESLEDILQYLSNRIEGLEEISVISKDGTVLIQFPEKEQTAKKAISDFVKITEDSFVQLDRGNVKEAIIKGRDRFLAFYKVSGADSVLCILGKSTANFGLLDSGCRSASEKIREILMG